MSDPYVVGEIERLSLDTAQRLNWQAKQAGQHSTSEVVPFGYPMYGTERERYGQRTNGEVAWGYKRVLIIAVRVQRFGYEGPQYLDVGGRWSNFEEVGPYADVTTLQAYHNEQMKWDVELAKRREREVSGEAKA